MLHFLLDRFIDKIKVLPQFLALLLVDALDFLLLPHLVLGLYILSQSFVRLHLAEPSLAMFEVFP